MYVKWENTDMMVLDGLQEGKVGGHLECLLIGECTNLNLNLTKFCADFLFI